MAKTLNEWAAEIHQNAVDHGWWDEPRSFGEIVALCHSELSEALEAYRDQMPMVCCDKYKPICRNHPGECEGLACLHAPLRSKPDGVATEMIDCIIRILDWCGYAGVDVDAILNAKHQYNKTRPYRHGGKVL